MSTPNPNKGKKGIAAERRLKAFEMYKLGYSYRDIGKELGCSFQRVGFYIKKTLDELKRARLKLGKDIIDAELEKLAMMEGPLLPLTQPRTIKLKTWDAVMGDRELEEEVGPDKDAVNAILKIHERRAKLLGLDAPKVLEHEVGDRLEDLIAGSRSPSEEKK